MSTPVSGNQFFTTLESNPKNHTMLKTTTLKVGDTAYINFLSTKGHHNTGDLLVDGNLVVRDLTLQGSTFEQNLQVDGTLDVPTALSTLESLAVTNASTLNGTLDVPSALSTLESLAVTNASTLNGTLGVPNALSTLESLAVTNASTLNGTLDVPSALSTLESLAVTNASTLNGTLDVPSALSTLESLAVTNASTLNGTLDVPSALSTLESLAVTNASTLNGTLDVPTALSTLDSLSVTQNAQLGGGIEVSNTTFTSTGSPYSIDSSHSQQNLFFDNNAGPAYVINLPLVSSVPGRKFKFIASGSFVANVQFVANAIDGIIGNVLNAQGAPSLPFAGVPSVTANFALITTSDWIEFTANGVGRWYVSGVSTNILVFTSP